MRQEDGMQESGRRRALVVDDSAISRMIAAAIAELSLARAPLVRRFGLTDFPVCGQNSEVLQASGLDADSLATAMADTLTSKRVVAAQ